MKRVMNEISGNPQEGTIMAQQVRQSKERRR